VPDYLKSEEICRIAMKDLSTFTAIPNSIIPFKERVENALKIQLETPFNKRDHCLHFIFDEDLTKDICLKFVSLYPEEVRKVPNAIMDRDIALEAVKTDPKCISWMPYRYLDQEIYDYVFAVDKTSIKHIPEENRTPEIIKYREDHKDEPVVNYFVSKQLSEEDKSIILQEWEESLDAQTSCEFGPF
jgi:hypothetical protein